MKINTTQFISPNFSNREVGVDTIVIHSTHMPRDSALERLCSNESDVSCHYLIDLDGNIYGLVSEDKVAWHAGKSSWRGKEKLNNSSVGIELVDIDDEGKGVKNFTSQQMNSLVWIMNDILVRYNISSQNIVAHSDIAPDRKDDPGEMFDWKFLANHGIGIFAGKVSYTENDKFIIKQGDKGKGVLMVQKLLRQYGYKISVDGVYGNQTKDVVIAFKRHFDARKIDDVFDGKSLEVLKSIILYSLRGN
jgi:N-acetylmuramoyl-L-alanine amidase